MKTLKTQKTQAIDDEKLIININWKQEVVLAIAAGRLLTNMMFLKQHDLSDADLAKIADACPNLVKLEIFSCDQVSDKGIDHLATLKKLECLNLCGLTNVTDKCLPKLMSMSKLSSISIEHCSVTEKAKAMILQHIAPK